MAEVIEVFGATALLEEVRHRRRALRVYNLISLLVYSFYFLCVVENVISQLPALANCCNAFPNVTDSPSKALSPNKLHPLSVLLSEDFIIVEKALRYR